MALPFTIYLQPPFIALSVSDSLQGLSKAGDTNVGLIEQTYAGCITVTVGWTGFFKTKNAEQVLTADGIQYFIVADTDFLFWEEVPV